MAPVIPDPDAIRAFDSEAAFEAWLRVNHDKASELYLRIYKKGSDVPTVTYAQAVDVALCWGWIDGLKKGYDESSFLQRFTPRKPRSIWSRINCQHVERLTAAGRMTPHGQKHIDAAKADGRWDAAYAGASKMTVPDDLLAAIEAEPKAFEMFQTLNKQNLYALAFRTHNVKTPAVRAKKVAGFVEMLARGETLYPNGRKAEKP
ncbi:MAG TPA: YdeI/OmpD-associated family protein [Arsenicitalea sp.]|nr:YdeI/OmpD-associated family protein [Arsenicitalea sp.]